MSAVPPSANATGIAGEDHAEDGHEHRRAPEVQTCTSGSTHLGVGLFTASGCRPACTIWLTACRSRSTKETEDQRLDRIARQPALGRATSPSPRSTPSTIGKATYSMRIENGIRKKTVPARSIHARAFLPRRSYMHVDAHVHVVAEAVGGPHQEDHAEEIPLRLDRRRQVQCPTLPAREVAQQGSGGTDGDHGERQPPDQDADPVVEAVDDAGQSSQGIHARDDAGWVASGQRPCGGR